MDSSTHRILDANANRAREALRVIEEFARFVLNDGLLAADVKQARHDLSDAVMTLEASAEADSGISGERVRPRHDLMAHRDIVRDVGRDTSTSEEGRRVDSVHVVVAAGKRLSEALRVLEEYGKLVSQTFAVSMERIRYEGYELERRLAMIVRARERFAGIRLYVILTEALCKNDWFATARAALTGGAGCLQLREKNLSDAELLSRAGKLASLCHDHDALFIINDRPDLAALCHADGVHLGQDDVAPADARRILPRSALVGMSTHTAEQVETACRVAPDYIAVGPMFASSTKPLGDTAGPETLSAAHDLTSLPLVAIGGIDESNAEQVLASAPCCLCVCSAVISREDVTAAAQRLRNLVDQACAAQGPSAPSARIGRSHAMPRRFP